MKHRSNDRLTSNAQKLRKNMTDAERRLWYNFLKRLPITVNRQKVIGNYIVDFYVHSAKLVIELDGEQHAEEANAAKDAVRDAWLREQGLTVVRYPSADVLRYFEGVCEDILRYLPEMPEFEIE